MKLAKGQPVQGVEVLFMRDIRKLTGLNKGELRKIRTFPRPMGGQRGDTYWSAEAILHWATT